MSDLSPLAQRIYALEIQRKTLLAALDAIDNEIDPMYEDQYPDADTDRLLRAIRDIITSARNKSA